MPLLINTTYEFLLNRPIVMLLVMALPLLFAAWMMRLYPSRRMLYLFTIPAIFSIGFIAFPYQKTGGNETFWTLMIFLLAIDGLLVLTALFDAVLTLGQNNFFARRKMVRTASQGKKYEVEIEVINRANRGCVIAVRDDLPASFEAQPDYFATTISGVSRTQFTYDIVCHQRGQAKLKCVHLIVRSPLGLWRGFFQTPVESTVNVYPDMQQITEYDLLARTNRLNLLGVRKSRKIGQDNEFERLRDYTNDDNFKHIDWRSTARRRKLTVREFQANQSQRIIFMVDCGRMMTGTCGDLSLLDHSVNAMLMLSYVALRQGDSVGMISFSNKVHNYTPPKSGVNHINRLLHASYNLDAEHVESRYDDAFMYLRTHCLRRALVIMITNVIDDINAVQIKQYLKMLAGRHLPMGVLLRDRDIYNAIDEFETLDGGGQTAIGTAVSNQTTLYQAAAAANVLTWRHQVIRDLQHAGVLAVDVFPENLTAQLVNQYLEIKARHLL
ncbi:MAG: DUF58 domain-containing protein [Planctomycetota bacterium]